MAAAALFLSSCFWFFFFFFGAASPKLWPSFRLFGHRKTFVVVHLFSGFVFLHILWFNQRKLYTHAEHLRVCSLGERISRVVWRSKVPSTHTLSCWGNKTETWPNSENWCRLCFCCSDIYLFFLSPLSGLLEVVVYVYSICVAYTTFILRSGDSILIMAFPINNCGWLAGENIQKRSMSLLSTWEM